MQKEERLPAGHSPECGRSEQACSGASKECCSQESLCPLPAGSGCRVSPQTTRRTDTAEEENADVKLLVLNNPN